MQEIIKEYGEAIAAAAAVLAAISLFAAVFTGRGGAVFGFVTSFCGYLL